MLTEVAMRLLGGLKLIFRPGVFTLFDLQRKREKLLGNGSTPHINWGERGNLGQRHHVSPPLRIKERINGDQEGY
eukprot:195887-Pelagomonas_calceolata.AAC.1